MFGDVAEKLLKMMGQSGNVPGALLAEDVQPALSALRDALGQAEEEEPPQPLGDDNDASAAHVAIHVRAKPLIDLLRLPQPTTKRLLGNLRRGMDDT